MRSIPVFNPFVSFSDAWAVFRSTLSGDISGTAKNVRQFESIFADHVGRKHGVALSNGSTALDLCFNALNLGPNDEVIVPSFTIISCLSSILRTGAIPVFIDVEPKTWNVSADSIRTAVTKKTKAVLVVHIYGLPSDIIEIEKFCLDKGIFLIEDAAESHGMMISDRNAGSFGTASCFSFYANKHVTTGEGGMVLTNDSHFAAKIRTMSNLGFDPEKRFVHQNLYWNYRMNGLAASLGINQVKKLPKILKRKAAQGKYYQELLGKYDQLFNLPATESNHTKNNYWVFGIVMKKQGIRDKVMKEMQTKGIETRPFFYPLHLQPALSSFKSKKIGKLEVSRYLGENGLYLPMGKGISQRKQKLICSTLVDIVAKL